MRSRRKLGEEGMPFESLEYVDTVFVFLFFLVQGEEILSQAVPSQMSSVGFRLLLFFFFFFLPRVHTCSKFLEAITRNSLVAIFSWKCSRKWRSECLVKEVNLICIALGTCCSISTSCFSSDKITPKLQSFFFPVFASKSMTKFACSLYFLLFSFVEG